MLATSLVASSATLIAVPAAHAGGGDSRGRTETVQEGGKIYASYEHMSSGFRPEDVTLKIHEKNKSEVLASVRLVGTDKCPATSDCYESVFRSEPVTLPAMGSYVIDVVAREGQANEVVQQSTGYLNYGLNPRLTLSSDRPWASYDHRTVKVSGSLVAEDPRTHEVKPFTDVGIYYRAQETRAQGWVWTNDAGRFTTTEYYDENSPATTKFEYMFDEQYASLSLPFRKQELKFTVDAPTGTVTAPYGSEIPVRGKLTRVADDGTEKPLAAEVRIGTGSGADSVVTTGEDGVLATGYTVVQGGRVSVRPTESNWFTAPAPHSFTVAGPSRTSKLSKVKGTVDKYRKVTFTGELGVTEGSYPAGTKAKISIDRRSSGGSWTSTGTFDAAYGASFKASSPKKADSGARWRLRLVNAGVTGTGVTLGRTYTKIWNDGVSPEGVRKGATLTAKGGLMHKPGSTWRPYAGHKVRVWFKAKAAGSAWKELGSTTTLSDGTFSKKFTAKQDGTWQMRYTDTASTHYADHGSEDYVDVR
ncbi:hypothetical protein GCM10018785_23940 [Streptomyces longispororuber]|uniref:Uncharacterized protein n=1 Tax=Streptomyces longispororuber TaxID=68230 RepID=A0A918ZIQ7_9ACTN|nr:hypothetical protein [Streptomyces longispororuber]GHE53607.1 hypothetical protein GCM10018785_23940 [Streptomyces longispororuber]